MLAFWKMAFFATKRSFLNVKPHVVVVCILFLFFLNVWKGFYSRSIFEVSLMFWGSGKCWFCETTGFEQNIEHC